MCRQGSSKMKKLNILTAAAAIVGTFSLTPTSSKASIPVEEIASGIEIAKAVYSFAKPVVKPVLKMGWKEAKGLARKARTNFKLRNAKRINKSHYISPYSPEYNKG